MPVLTHSSRKSVLIGSATPLLALLCNPFCTSFASETLGGAVVQNNLEPHHGLTEWLNKMYIGKIRLINV